MESKRIEKVKKKSEEKKSLIEQAKDVVAKKKTDKKEDDKVLKELVITIGLRRLIDSNRIKRAPRAIRLIKAKIERIVKKPVTISTKLNEVIWARGIKKPPKKIKVKVLIKKDKAEIVPA